MNIKTKILAERRLKELSRVLHHDDVVYTLIDGVEHYVKDHCLLPSDFDYFNFEKGLIKIIDTTIC